MICEYQHVVKIAEQEVSVTLLRVNKLRKFQAEDHPQFWSDLWTSRFSGALSSVRVSPYTYMYVREYSAVIILKNIRLHRLKFGRPGVQALGICALLVASVE
jgi:hypothetical protein